MSFRSNTGKSIQQAFEEYDHNNPKVYAHFCRLVWKAIKKGYRRISAKLIINVIRWEVYLQPKAQEKTEVILGTDMFGTAKSFKINDAYASRYARKFIKENPGAEAYFELRELRA